MGEHVACAACGSSDAGWRDEYEGKTRLKCHKCGAVGPAVSGDLADAAPVESRKAAKSGRLLDVEPRPINSRKLTHATCEKWGYGYAKFNGKTAQVAQYRDGSGRVVAQKLRFPDKSFLILGDASAAGLYGEHLWRDGGRMVVVTEGELDALSVSQVQDNRWPVVSVPNGASGAKGAVLKSLEFLEKFDRVVFMLDNDAPGREAAVECAAALTPGKGYIATLPLKDASDMLQADRAKELVDAIWGAKVYRPDGLVSGDAVWERIRRPDFARAIPLPHAGLQSKLRGLRMGELLTLVAGTGTGKTTFTREIVWSAVAAGERVGIVALEESVRRTALGLLSVGLSRPLHLDADDVANDPAVRRAWDGIKDQVVFYEHFGSLAGDNLTSRIRYMMKAEGCSLVVLDHISIVVSGMDEADNERRTLDRLMTTFASLAQETGSAMVLVSHLSRREGQPHEEGRPVTLADLRGSHAIGQLSHNVVSLERDQQADGDDRNSTVVRVLKCRHTGDTGIAGFLVYNPETGRLMEHQTAFTQPDNEEEPE
jgi:twinkle protein